MFEVTLGRKPKAPWPARFARHAAEPRAFLAGRGRKTRLRAFRPHPAKNHGQIAGFRTAVSVFICVHLWLILVCIPS